MYKAKEIVDRKFWVLESEAGEPIGTMKATSNKIRVIIGDRSEDFSNIDHARDSLDIQIVSEETEDLDATESDLDNADSELLDDDAIEESISNEVYDFPTRTVPKNALWNVKMKLPIYTKTGKSNSYHCAGYYIIRFKTGWVKSYCPKLVTLEQYDFRGPYKTRAEMIDNLRTVNEPT